MDMESFNTEDFISEIKAQPAIWNSATEEYSNKICKRNAWEEVILKFHPLFNEKTTGEKNNIISCFQRKWKSLRDSYSRELLRRKKEKSGPTSLKGRKQYTYFDQLRFLKTVVKPNRMSLEEVENMQSTEGLTEVPAEDKAPVMAQKRICSKSLKKEPLEEEKLFTVLKERLLQGSTKEPDTNDEDTLFMLSLVPELRKVPESMKLDIKGELLNVFKRARLQQHATTSSDPVISNICSFNVPLSHPSEQCDKSPSK
jgi:hypothetical protein